MDAAMRGGTGWRRFGIFALPAFLVAGTLIGTSLFGILPLRLSISGQPFKLSANSRAEVPHGIEAAYSSGMQLKNGGETVPALYAHIPEAVLSDGLCLSLVLTFPFIGTNTLQINTTGRTVAKDLSADAAGMQLSNATLSAQTTDGQAPALDGSNVKQSAIVGRDAGEIGGRPGTFGLSAPGAAVIGALQASANGARVNGTLQISGIQIPKLGHGSGPGKECF